MAGTKSASIIRLLNGKATIKTDAIDTNLMKDEKRKNASKMSSRDGKRPKEETVNRLKTLWRDSPISQSMPPSRAYHPSSGSASLWVTNGSRIVPLIATKCVSFSLLSSCAVPAYGEGRKRERNLYQITSKKQSEMMLFEHLKILIMPMMWNGKQREAEGTR